MTEVGSVAAEWMWEAGDGADVGGAIADAGGTADVWGRATDEWASAAGHPAEGVVGDGCSIE